MRLGTQAERYLKEDPVTALIKLRQYGEALAQTVAAKARNARLADMTMIATFVSDEVVVQVVDRRLTAGGKLYAEQANKALCVGSCDAAFSIAYTGLVMRPDRTDVWLTEYLVTPGILQLPLPKLLESMASALSKEFNRFAQFPPDQRRLTLAIGGFCIRGPFMAMITNHEDKNGAALPSPTPDFTPHLLLRNGKKMHRLDFMIHGTEAALNEDLRVAIDKLRPRLFGKPGIRIANALVAVIRRAAQHPTYGNFIGPDCVAAIHTAGSPEIQCEDYPVGQAHKVHLPHFITPNMAFKHVSFQYLKE